MRWIKETILPRAATAWASLITTALLVLPRNVSPSPRLLLSIGLALLLGSTGEAQEVRFEACADGLTVADTATGLLWERKTGDPNDSDVFCETAPGGCPDPHEVNNKYQWSSTGTAPDGNAYTDFLASLNAASFAGHADWRLPIISGLQSILVGPGVESVANADPASGGNATGQATTCDGNPCIDPDFAAVGGPTASSNYWSASTGATNPFVAWGALFSVGNLFIGNKANVMFVRAVRAGSCPPAGTGNIRLIEGSLVPAAALVLANPSETLRLERGLLGQLGAGRSSGASGVVLTGGVLAVPEPGTVLLWAAGILGLLALGRLRPVSFESEVADVATQGEPS
jgi:hypothetical protein